MPPRYGNVWSALSPPSADAVTAARSADLERLYRPQVFLEGSGSLVPGTAGPLTDLTAVPPDERDALHTDFVPEAVEHRPGRKK